MIKLIEITIYSRLCLLAEKTSDHKIQKQLFDLSDNYSDIHYFLTLNKNLARGLREDIYAKSKIFD